MTNLALSCYGFKAYTEVLPYSPMTSAWVWVDLAGLLEVARLACLGLILTGIVGLKLCGD